MVVLPVYGIVHLMHYILIETEPIENKGNRKWIKIFSMNKKKIK